jgi:hypothetical protein
MTNPSSSDLQPWQLAMAAFRRVWQERDDLLRLAAVPVIVAFAFNVWFQPYAEVMLGAMQPSEQPDFSRLEQVQGPVILFWLANWLVIAVFVVNWMRHLVLGDAGASGLGLKLGRRHFRMWLHLVGFQLAILIIFFVFVTLILMMAPVAALIFAAMILYVIWCLIVVVRLTPVWVGIAIDAPMKVRDAWRRSAGLGVKLAVAFVVVSFLLFVLQTMLVILSASFGVIQMAPLALSFVSVVIQFIMFAAICAVFVLAYPRFVSETV